MKELRSYRDTYKNLSHIFSGYFHEDAELSYDEIMNNDVLESFYINEITEHIIPEIDGLISENLSDHELEEVLVYAFSASSTPAMKKQAGVTTNKDWLLDIKKRFQEKIEKEN